MTLMPTRGSLPLPLVSAGFALSLVLGCGSTAPSSAPGSTADAGDAVAPTFTFTVTGPTSSVVSGGHGTLSAADANGNPIAVTWAPPANRGTVDDSNVYHAPILFTEEDVAIVATRVDHPEATATVSVHVLGALPLLASAGGPVLKSPVFTAVSFADDTDAAIAENVASKIGSGPYWASVTKEYGVGPATATAPVRLTTNAPAVTDDDAIGAWLAGMLDGTHPEFPAPTDGSAYLISYPPTSSVTFKGDKSCTWFSAYHSETKVGSRSVPYVVGTHCTTTKVEDFEFAVAEDLIETALDPFRFTAPAFSAPDASHLVWNYVREGEAAGLCQFRMNGTQPSTALGFPVPQIWSNSAAAAGHEPCAPSADNHLVAAFPILEDDVPVHFPITYDTPAGIQGTTKGVHIPVGQTKTIDVIVYSDGPADEPHTFNFVSVAGSSQKPDFKGELTPDTGKNGDHLTLKLTTLQGEAAYGGGMFALFAGDPPSDRVTPWSGATMGFVLTDP